MPDEDDPPRVQAAPNDAHGMPSTRWTWVIQAAGTDGSQAIEALGELYKRYYGPLLGFVKSKLRSRGGQPEAGEDLLQGFFNHLISKSGLSKVRREKGRFRSFLRVALSNYMIDQWRKEPDEPSVRLDIEDEVTGEKPDLPDTEAQPDLEFDRAWTIDLLRSTMSRLKQEYKQRDRQRVFDLLHVYLAEKKPGVSYREAATNLGMSEGAVKTEVSRMRQRYREVIDAEIADTLCRPTLKAIEEEKRALFAALGGG